MGTIGDKKNYLADTKEAIKQAIISKGQPVADTDTFRSYASKIGAISSSGVSYPEWSVEYWQGIAGSSYCEIQAEITDLDYSLAEIEQMITDYSYSGAMYIFSKDVPTLCIGASSVYQTIVNWKLVNDGSEHSMYLVGGTYREVELEKPATDLNYYYVIVGSKATTGCPNAFFGYDNYQNRVYNVRDIYVTQTGVDTIPSNYSFKGHANIKCIPPIDLTGETTISDKFSYCLQLETIPLLAFSTVTNWRNAFAYSSNLKTIALVDASKVTTLLNAFYNCTKLERMPPLDLSNVENMSGTFYGCTALKSIEIGNSPKLTQVSNAFYGCTGLAKVKFINAPNIQYAASFFDGCSKLTAIENIICNNMEDVTALFKDCALLSDVMVSSFDSATTASQVYSGCVSIKAVATEFPLATNLEEAFSYCSSLETIDVLNAPLATNISGLFEYCSSLETIDTINAPMATDIEDIFAFCSNLTHINTLNLGSVVAIEDAFSACIKLQEIPLFDLSACTSVRYTFRNCRAAKTLPKFDFRNVTNMYYCFNYMLSLASLPALDTSQVTDFRYAFYFCCSLTHIDTEQVENKYGQMINPWQIGSSVDFQYSRLDLPSIKHIFENLKPTSSATITINFTSRNYLEAEPATDGVSANLFQQLAAEATAKGWAISVSTSY